MSRTTAIQKVLEQEMKLTNTTTEITHTGDYAKQNSIGMRYAWRNGVYYAEKTTWILSSENGAHRGDPPTGIAITKVDNDNLQAVTRIVKTNYAPGTEYMSSLGDYIDNAMVAKNDTLITAHGAPYIKKIRGAGMDGTSAYAWEIDLSGDFAAPVGTTVSNEMRFAVLGTGSDYITVIALQSFWVKADALIHEVMRKYKISASGAVVGNTLVHHKTYPPLGTGTPILYASMGRLSPMYYVYTPSYYALPEENRIQTNIYEAETGALIYSENRGYPEFRSTISSRNNFLYNCRAFETSEEKPLMGGRYITMTTSMPSIYNGFKIFWESVSGGVKEATLPFYDTYGNNIFPYIVYGISPSDEIYVIWNNRETDDIFLVKHDSSGNVVWEVRKNDWPAAAWVYLIHSPVIAMRASPGVGTDEDGLYFNNRMLFDTLGRPVLMGTQLVPASTTLGRTPYTRVVLDPNTGKPIRTPLLGTVPAISGKVGLAIADIMSYNSVTDTVKQTFLIANTQSTSPISTTATLGKMRRMSVESKLMLYISVKDADSKILDYSSYNIEVTVDDAYAWPNYDSVNKVHYIELKPGQNWKATVKSQMYVKSEKTGTFGNDNQRVDIIMYPRDWSRKSYEIYTPQDLIDMRKDNMGLYTLMNDIDMSGIEWETPFTSTEEAFMGSLNGNRYTIKNLNANNENGGYTALCGVVQNGAFYDIAFENCNMYGSSGHALGVLSGFVLVAPLFYNEDPPSSYEELDTYFHNISFKNCSLRQKYSYSGSGMLFGEMSWSKPVIHGTVINNIEVNKCRLIGGEYGSETLGGAWGNLSIVSAGSDE